MIDELIPQHVNILLVDDQERNLGALEAILQRPGFNIVRAASANDALREVMTRDFAVILLDVMMPEIDGFECARLIKQRWQTRETPIIFVTAVASELVFVFKGYESGAVDYITKPLEPAVVKAKVNIFVQLWERTQLLKAQLGQMRKMCQDLEGEVAEGRKTIDEMTAEFREFIRGCERRLDQLPLNMRRVTANPIIRTRDAGTEL